MTNNNLTNGYPNRLTFKAIPFLDPRGGEGEIVKKMKERGLRKNM